MTTLTVSGRFNGPEASGNGGYACALFAGLLDGPAEVSLRSPVPLDVPLEAARDDAGAVAVTSGETLVAEARPAEPPALEVPAVVSPERARVATARYPAPAEGLFSRCFVCGRAREDSMQVFAGPVEGTDLVASPWTPPDWAAAADGVVRPEFVWAVLDCPTYFALYPDSSPLSFLVAMSARLGHPVRAGEEHVVIAWPIAKDGRKHRAGSAVLSADGEVLAAADVLLIDTDS
jgi:hypothetical protein